MNFKDIFYWSGAIEKIVYFILFLQKNPVETYHGLQGG